MLGLSRARLRERSGVILLTLLLQIGFVALLTLSIPTSRPTQERETTILLLSSLTVRKAQQAPITIDTQENLPRVTTGSEAFTIPVPIIGLPLAQVPTQGNLQAFGRGLFGCAPEDYANLSAEDRARCPPPGEGVAIQEAPNLMGSHSHVKDEAHWEDEWARERSPLLLPCGGFINIACLLGKIADGSLSDYGDPSKWPHYAVKQLPEEDLYKIDQAYDAWHKNHGTGTGEKLK